MGQGPARPSLIPPRHRHRKGMDFSSGIPKSSAPRILTLRTEKGPDSADGAGPKFGPVGLLLKYLIR
ncbi:hypothetical protein CMK17_19590 [Candidatus Poribacteria bacterium]|nr:hypothetical protein [Candidatus Poribacteria bacterium]